MRILILEDDSSRVKQFYEMFSDCSLVVVNDAKDAISFAGTSIFDAIFLDHDLGGQVYVDSDNENTGYQVAKILPQSPNCKTPVIIHSWNPSGVKNMKEVLQSHKGQVASIPFGSFGRDILK